MHIIGKLIELTLVACCDEGVIDWYPGDGEPETFEAEADISYSALPMPYGTHYDANFYVILCGVFCIIDAEHMEVWHASKLEIEV
jgi:hypothetical protein